jgi:hypothetical protein
MPATTEKDQELISKVPTDLPKKRRQSVVVSRGKRKALGNKITTITLHPDNSYSTTGPDGEDWGTTKKFAVALRAARLGPQDDQS